MDKLLNIRDIPSPCYVIEEDLLRKNLQLIKSVSERAGVEIILAFKAFALWKTFPIFREFGFKSTASSVNEAQLALEEMGSLAHSYSPAYTEENFPVFMEYSSHITFNSLSQFERFYPRTLQYSRHISCGLRINPEVSVVETDLYNPAAPGSRLGIAADLIPEKLPQGVEGLHFHVLCENSSYDLEKVLTAVEKKFGNYFSQIQWLNMGGGHLMTRKDYDIEHLVSLLTSFQKKYPHLKIILEPGSAFIWQTGTLVASVVDIVENQGIKTAMLDVSFSCHMPDCLEMPYQPEIRGAITSPPTPLQPPPTPPKEGRKKSSEENCQLSIVNCQFKYRMGGNSCLSGDYVGDWIFEKPLQIGDRIIFEDMIHYTTVKTTMFNGVPHPSIAMLHSDGTLEILRKYGYEDYKSRMD
ncbi:MAG: carboxynorspermidine decarboxylase [Tannerella sp.]|jgi:carboxynorspermidine decarboxylase|nr:carboxynorspermidine decarboxylase [Tannerella sp.]